MQHACAPLTTGLPHRGVPECPTLRNRPCSGCQGWKDSINSMNQAITAESRQAERRSRERAAGCALPHRQVLNAIDEIGKEASLRQYLQLLDELPYRKFELGSVDNACEVDALPLPSCGFYEQILILGKEHPAQFASPVEQPRVFPLCWAGFLSREHLCSASSQAASDGARHMHVHVQRDAHPPPSLARK